MNSRFSSLLSRARAAYFAGLLLASGLRVAAAALALFLGVVLLDAWLGFGEPARAALAALVLVGGGALAVLALASVFSLSLRDVACWADSRLPHRRRPILSALELASSPNGDRASSLSGFLVEASLERGRSALLSLPASRLLPRSRIRAAALRFAAALFAWIALLALWPSPVGTHALRILAPGRDVPPWSRLSFSVSPEVSSVVYGDNLEICASVSGPLGSTPVLFDVRSGGSAASGPGFRESTNRFVHRFERVVQPARFCVRAGRARSRWFDLSVLYLPRIASARVSLLPPPYSGLPAREFYLGGQKLAGLPGSRVVLVVAANRPLRRGFVLLSSPDGLASRVEGVPNLSSIRFEWSLDFNASASIHVEDSLGTPNAQSLVFSQEIVPDVPPSASILSPPPFSLAVPDSVVAVEASAEDDLGLRSVAIVRNLAGYRDRALPLPLAPGNRAFLSESALDLNALGVRPGDSIELYLEAADSNPNLLGNALSDLVRIDVISPDDYADILRLRASVDEFGDRYRALSAQLDALRQALAAVADPNPNPDAAERAVRDALDAWNRLDGSYRQIAADFAIFDHERQLSKTLDAIRARSEPFALRMERLPDSAESPADVAADWLASIAEPAADLDRQAQDAALLDLLVQVARAALDLQRSVDRQAALVRDLERHEANLRATPPERLADFAVSQAVGSAALANWLSVASNLADSLPTDQDSLAAEIREVVSAIRLSRAQDSMDLAAAAATGHNAAEALRLAREALDALRSACSRCERSGNRFAAMCRNPGAGFDVSQSLRSTLDQLCMALACQFARNSGSGGIGLGGIGSSGGDASGGYWASSSSLLDVPLSGPARLPLRSSSSAAQGRGGSGPAGAGAVRSAERIDRSSSQPAPSRAVSLDEIPERYREPARRFYGIGDTQEGSSP